MNFSLSEKEKMNFVDFFCFLRIFRWQMSEAQIRYGNPIITIVIN